MTEIARYDLEGRPVDLFGRVIPHHMGFLTFAKAVPGLLGLFESIPDQFWTLDGMVAVVACPCGEEPTILVNGITQCACERVFTYLGPKGVRVANSPKGTVVNAGPVEPEEPDPEV